MLSLKLVRISMAFGLFSAATPAFAYVDPGTGAMLVQAVLALFVAVVFYLRNPSQLWRALQNWLKRNRKP